MTVPSRLDRSPNTSERKAPPEGHAALALFQLAPDRLHLNHGSYGAVPKSVAAEQDRFRALIERDPTTFFGDVLPGELRRLAGVIAARFGGAPGDWVFCENATSAVSSVLSSLAFGDGDEILTTSHAYGAVLKAMSVFATRNGASLVVADVPAIVESEDQIVEAVVRGFTARTKLLIVDHITSATALIFPVARIAYAARAAGIPVLVDGAHAPGQIAFDVGQIGADWYTGNAHKWLFAPRGCGLLWTTPDLQVQTRPAVLSHGAQTDYAAAFDWIGTRDVTPWLCLEAAIVVHDSLGGPALMQRNRAMAAEAADFLATALGGQISGPPALRAAMASVNLGPAGQDLGLPDRLRRRLAMESDVVAPVFLFKSDIYLRISAQIYNEPRDYPILANRLSNHLKAERFR